MNLTAILLVFVQLVLLSDQQEQEFYPDYAWNDILNIPDESIDYGEPLFLSSYLENGDIVGGQQAALVEPLLENITSYSGYFTVNQEYNSNLFFWFFPAEINDDTAPLVIWLQGGPGVSSLYGLFTENGPFYINKLGEPVKREYYWTTNLNILYIDSPVGTGFSFTDNPEGYATNQVDVANNLYLTLQQFLYLFPQYQSNDLYITGESYAGKYVPAFAYAIDQYNELSNYQINLKGIAVGNGLCDPETMLNYGDYLYEIGLIDINGRDQMIEMQKTVKQLIENEKFDEADGLMDEMIMGDKDTLYKNLTGSINIYNYLKTGDEKLDNVISYISKTIRSKIHVGNTAYYMENNENVTNFLKPDSMRSVKPWVEQLLDNQYRVVLYSGQLDIIVAYPLSLNFIQSLNWTGAEEYKNAERNLWYVDGELAGYSKTAGRFTEILVRDAGHMVPADQPKWALDLITRVTSDTPF